MRARQRVWTARDVLALGTRTDVPTAYEILTGRGRDAAYRAVRRGEFPVPVVHVGDHQMIVPVQPILDLLCITPDKSAGGASPAPPAITETRLPPKEADEIDDRPRERRSA